MPINPPSDNDMPPLDSYALRAHQPDEETLAIAKGIDVTPVKAGEAIRLYHFTTSTCSQRVRLAAAEKQVRYESHMVNWLAFENITPAYLAINPRGVVPTWVDEGRAVFDSPTIARYIDARYQGPALRPEDPVSRAEVEAWVDAADAFPNRYLTYYQQYELAGHSLDGVDFKPWADELQDRCAVAKKTHPALASLYQSKIDDFSSFFVELTNTGFMERCIDLANRRLDELEAQLCKTPFIGGDAYTLADTCWTTALVRLESYHQYGKRVWFDASFRPALTDYVERIKRRPSFAAAYVDYFQGLPQLLTGAEPPLIIERFNRLAHMYDDYARPDTNL